MNRSVTNRPVVFFDGVCGLCDGFVRFVLKRDRKKQFLFSPLQGETAAKTLAGYPKDLGGRSIVYVDGAGVHTASEAVIKIVSRMGGVWRAARILMLVPAFLRNAAYGYISANRYEWFGRFDSPVLPPGGFSDRFLP